LVITAMVGSITSRNRGISPGTLAPASTNQRLASSGAARIVSGTPTRLFRLPLVACTWYWYQHSADHFLGAGLPARAVTATTGLPGASNRRRAPPAAERAERVDDSKYGSRPPATCRGAPRRPPRLALA